LLDWVKIIMNMLKVVENIKKTFYSIVHHVWVFYIIILIVIVVTKLFSDLYIFKYLDTLHKIVFFVYKKRIKNKHKYMRQKIQERFDMADLIFTWILL